MKVLLLGAIAALAGCAGAGSIPATSRAFDTPGGPVGKGAIVHRIADHPTQMAKVKRLAVAVEYAR